LGETHPAPMLLQHVKYFSELNDPSALLLPCLTRVLARLREMTSYGEIP
jgi:hypothetical protein